MTDIESYANLKATEIDIRIMNIYRSLLIRSLVVLASIIGLYALALISDYDNSAKIISIVLIFASGLSAQALWGEIKLLEVVKVLKARYMISAQQGDAPDPGTNA